MCVFRHSNDANIFRRFRLAPLHHNQSKTILLGSEVALLPSVALPIIAWHSSLWSSLTVAARISALLLKMPPNVLYIYVIRLAFNCISRSPSLCLPAPRTKF